MSGTIYGKPDYVDECFISGHVYCCADIPGVPEITVPIQFPIGEVRREHDIALECLTNLLSSSLNGYLKRHPSNIIKHIP